MPIDIPEDSFEVEGSKFDPFKLDFDNPEKDKMREAVLNVLMKVIDFSNANIIKNTDALLATTPVNPNIQWVGETGNCVPENQYVLSFQLFLCSV